MSTTPHRDEQRPGQDRVLREPAQDPLMNQRSFVYIGAGTVALGVLLGAGATQIHGDAGYGGVGPAFLPWLVAIVLVGLGLLLIRSARTKLEAMVEAPEFAPRWLAVAWVSVGLLVNAMLIERIGFIASCALLFALAARGFRIGADDRPTLRDALRDVVLGLIISAPVFWIFTKVLGLNLPALFKGGWI
jgi:putative tricarboxylic transport membrane protein